MSIFSDLSCVLIHLAHQYLYSVYTYVYVCVISSLFRHSLIDIKEVFWVECVMIWETAFFHPSVPQGFVQRSACGAAVRYQAAVPSDRP